MRRSCTESSCSPPSHGSPTTRCGRSIGDARSRSRPVRASCSRPPPVRPRRCCLGEQSRRSSPLQSRCWLWGRWWSSSGWCRWPPRGGGDGLASAGAPAPAGAAAPTGRCGSPHSTAGGRRNPVLGTKDPCQGRGSRAILVNTRRRWQMAEPVELTVDECVDLLNGGVFGRVALSTPVGPRIVPVNYAMYGDDIVFRTTPYSELGTYGWNV